MKMGNKGSQFQDKKLRPMSAIAPLPWASTISVRFMLPETIKTTKKGRLLSGQSLRIPSDVAIAFAREIPDPRIERYGGSSSSTTLTSRGLHVVKRGESLGAIAKRYGTTVARLKSLNGIKGSRVIAGQTLRVRSSTATTSSTSSAKKASAKKSTVQKTSAPPKKTASSKKKTPPKK